MADPNTEQELSYLGKRLREKSTYAGLTVVVAGLLPFLAHVVPGLHGVGVDAVVNTISAGGMFLGGVLAIFFPEKGSSE